MKTAILSLLVGSAAFAEVTSIRLTTDANFHDRAAVMIIKHESPAYSLTPQGQKEAEERSREFKLEREKQEAEKKQQVAKKVSAAPAAPKKLSNAEFDALPIMEQRRLIAEAEQACKKGK